MTLLETPTTRTDRSERTRHAILDAGARCFGAAGFHQASMDEIAREAGVTKPTVYAHVGSKGELFETLLRTVLDGLDEIPLAGVATNEQVEPELVDYAMTRIDMLLDERTFGLLRAASAEGIRRPEWSRAVIASLGTSRFESWLADLADRGLLDTRAVGSAESAAELFWSQVEGALFFPAAIGMTAVPTPAERRRTVRRCVHVFLRAFATDAPARSRRLR